MALCSVFCRRGCEGPIGGITGPPRPMSQRRGEVRSGCLGCVIKCPEPQWLWTPKLGGLLLRLRKRTMPSCMILVPGCGSHTGKVCSLSFSPPPPPPTSRVVDDDVDDAL